MNRHAIALQIIPEKFNDFRSGLGRVWNRLTRLMDDLEISNFSLWNIEDLVFGYYETDPLSPTPSEHQKAEFRSLEAEVGDSYRWISGPDQEMRLMYHDFGIVRPNKELIRHRVFVTKLKGDFQEEYKRRHDGLIAARHGKEVNQSKGLHKALTHKSQCFKHRFHYLLRTECLREAARRGRERMQGK